MSNPINFSFVKPTTISLDGGRDVITVLTLDTKANDEYWQSFYALRELVASNPDIKEIELSQHKLTAAQYDILQEYSTPGNLRIDNIPVTITDDDSHVLITAIERIPF